MCAPSLTHRMGTVGRRSRTPRGRWFNSSRFIMLRARIGPAQALDVLLQSQLPPERQLPIQFLDEFSRHRAAVAWHLQRKLARIARRHAADQLEVGKLQLDPSPIQRNPDR